MEEKKQIEERLEKIHKFSKENFHKSNNFSKLLMANAKLIPEKTDVEKGVVTFSLFVGEDLQNPGGNLHGGAAAALIDEGKIYFLLKFQ